jgi:nicotinate phosphoribosyltransferase
VGTRIGVSADAPSLDSVYKLVEVEGRPVAKLSAAKRTLPGPKQVWRNPAMTGDVIGLRDERGPAGAEALLEPVMSSGKRVGSASLTEARSRFAAELGRLPDILRTLSPEPYPVDHSPALQRLDARARAVMRG